MSKLRNRVHLIGNLGKDPEVKELESGKKVAKLSIATTESYKNAKGERVSDTQWHNIVAWESKAGIVEKYMKKGDQIAVEGKIVNRNYEDKNGQKQYVTEIVANEFLLLEKKKD